MIHNLTLQICLIKKVKNLLNKEEIKKKKGLKILTPNRLTISLANYK